MLFSVIIPVYNVELYLERCIDSVLKQDCYNYEIVLVNDGSTDSSGSICDKFAENNSNVKVIHQENGGLSKARNAGIEVASGEYIIFLDSDDELESSSFGLIQDNLEKNKVDILHLGYKVCYPDNHTEEIILGKPLDDIFTGKEFLKFLINENKYSAPVVQYICRREFLNNNNLSFYEGVLHEDEEFSPRLLQAAKTVKYLNCCFYKYMKRDNSITTKRNDKNFIDLLKVSQNLLEAFANEGDRELRKLMLDQASFLYMFACYPYRYKYEDIPREFYIDPFTLIKYRKGIRAKLSTFLFIANKKKYFQMRKSERI